MDRFACLSSVLFSLALSGCATAIPASRPSNPLLIDVTRTGETWQARYTMPTDAPIWALRRSGLDAATRLPWRQQQWRVVTPGVTLDRIGEFDSLVAATGNVPREVIVEFVPSAADVLDNHEPAVVLSNGSLALLTGAFSAFPMKGAEELRTMRLAYVQDTELTFRDVGAQVLHRGEYSDAVTLTGDAEGGYVVFGPVNLVRADYGSLVIDRGLPPWLAKEVASFTPTVLTGYRERLGEAGNGAPMIISAWAGPTEGGAGIAGTAVDNTLTLRFEGSGFERRSPATLAYARNLIAHETGHLWLGQTLGYATREDRWISEGGVSLMTVRMQEALDDTSEATSTAQYSAAMVDRYVSELEHPRAMGFLADARAACPDWLGRGALRDAWQRLEFDAYYDCGAMFALAVEQAGAPRGEDFFDFVALLIQRNPDREVSTDEWLDTATDFGLAAERRELIHALLQGGSSDGAAALDRLLGE